MRSLITRRRSRPVIDIDFVSGVADIAAENDLANVGRSEARGGDELGTFGFLDGRLPNGGAVVKKDSAAVEELIRIFKVVHSAVGDDVKGRGVPVRIDSNYGFDGEGDVDGSGSVDGAGFGGSFFVCFVPLLLLPLLFWMLFGVFLGVLLFLPLLMLFMLLLLLQFLSLMTLVESWMMRGRGGMGQRDSSVRKRLG